MSRLVEESHRCRRIVGQLAGGEDLLQGLLAVCHARTVRSAHVEARGVLDQVSLSCYDPDGRALGKPRRLRGAMQLLQASGVAGELSGQLHLELGLVMVRQTDNGIELLGGVVHSARVVSCQFVIEAHDDLILRFGREVGSGLLGWQQVIAAGGDVVEAAPADPDPAAAMDPQREPSSPGTKPSWADAVMASVRASNEREEERDAGPLRAVRVGDILDHQKFGRCLVQKVDADQEYVTVRLRNSRLVRLNLEVLQLRFQGEEDGHQVFTAAPGGAG